MRFILLRGLGKEQLHWQPLIASMKSMMPGCEIETPDLPGSGILFQQKSPRKISHYLPYIEQQLSDSNKSTYLVGLSLGGMIALKWAELAPSKFKKIILINTSSRLNYFYQRFKIHNLLLYPKIFCTKKSFEREKAIYQLTCNKVSIDESVISRWEYIQQIHPVSKMNQLNQIIAGLFFKLPKPGNLPPVHILYSKSDRLVSYQCSEKLVDYYQTTFDCHEWAGHDLSEDDPNWIAVKLTQLAT